MNLHHIAVIVSEEERSVAFYRLLGFSVIFRTVRQDRGDVLLFLSDGDTVLELFVRPHAPERVSGPEAYGLRHLAFSCPDLYAAVCRFRNGGYEAEPIRMDRMSGKRLCFLQDPDGLPIELREEPEGR